MQSIAPGVTQVATSTTSNTFLIEGDAGLILVDAGMAKGVPALLSAIAELGHRPADLAAVVLTHAHPDHVQGVPQVRERTGARVLVHQADAAWLPAGRVPAEGRSGFTARCFDRLPVAHWTPFEADATLEDGELVEGGGGLRVIHTPGHSPGHIALLHEPTGTLLAGDAVFGNGGLGFGPDSFAADPERRPAGVKRIPMAEVKAVGFGHGAPLTGAQLAEFREFLARVA
ncbi:MBL fold metallo-hydrolase [Kitasatospora sp. NBC_01266]|uniref:MBL fold metallo-hydrolase n=1 Tax=Kitasatospora sp. NBC_01266 TaxID=2903572 RepID=UPI002E369629|nr:MBL fold metallo-hydrolase [Kitasatospora sp. NBC_01266]